MPGVVFVDSFEPLSQFAASLRLCSIHLTVATSSAFLTGVAVFAQSRLYPTSRLKHRPMIRYDQLPFAVINEASQVRANRGGEIVTNIEESWRAIWIIACNARLPSLRLEPIERDNRIRCGHVSA